MNTLFPDVYLRWQMGYEGEWLRYELPENAVSKCFSIGGFIATEKKFSVKSYWLVQDSYPFRHRSGAFMVMKSCCAYGDVLRAA